LSQITFNAASYPWGRDHFTLRQAAPGDELALAALKQCVWPEESADPQQIAGVLSAPGHLTLVAEREDRLAGFLDCFFTDGPDGLRWEVDLLGVHPDFRGRKLAEALVRAGLQAAQEIPARALIQTRNTASQKVFARCGFSRLPPVMRLYLSSQVYNVAVQPTPEARIIPVTTLGYSGMWLEASFTQADLLAARTYIRQDIRLAGAVIPAIQAENWLTADKCGYSLAAEYQWWTKEG
jgi:ribosomal protein S18 acetylase RimI-like enzyme